MVGLALAAAGCGDDDPESITEVATAPPPPTTPTSTTPDLQEPAPETTPPPATTTAPPATTATTPPAATSPEDQPGGAGDEEGIRQPVDLVISAGPSITPASVQLSAFLPVAVSVANEDSEPHTITLLVGGRSLGGGAGLTVDPGQTREVSLPGVPPGRSVVEVDGGADRTVVQVVRDAAGP